MSISIEKSHDGVVIYSSLGHCHVKHNEIQPLISMLENFQRKYLAEEDNSIPDNTGYKEGSTKMKEEIYHYKPGITHTRETQYED